MNFPTDASIRSFLRWVLLVAALGFFGVYLYIGGSTRRQSFERFIPHFLANITSGIAANAKTEENTRLLGTVNAVRDLRKYEVEDFEMRLSLLCTAGSVLSILALLMVYMTGEQTRQKTEAPGGK